MIASFFLGALAVMLFSEMILGTSVGLFAPQCLFLGTITTATSVGITARILSERRKLDSPEGVTILSAAVIDDVMGIILLAVIMGLLTASKAEGSVDWGHIGIIAAKAVGVWLAATIFGLAASRKISFLLKWFGERTSIAIMAFGLALVLAGLFEEAGLAMVIGAYVMGLSLSQADIRHVVQEKLRPVYALLVPVFFCTTGMQIDLTALASPPVLLFGVVYAFLAMAAKVFGCGIPALLTNFNLRGAARIGFGMAPRCEVALIIAGVGLAANLISPVILAGVIVMIIINNVLAVPILALLIKSPASGTRSEVGGGQARTSLPFEFTSIEMADFFAARLVAVFEAEGFFVHQLSRRNRLYQLLKDKSVIDFQQSAETITFTCDSKDVSLVNTAVHEALAELERVVRGLQKPLDSKPMLARLQDTGPLGPVGISMKGLLNERLIKCELDGNTKAEVIDELLDLLHVTGLVSDIGAAREAVLQRESSMSTGLQFGVAIPHGKTDVVDRLVCAVGIKKRGIDFESMDGEPAKIFVLTLSPKSKPAPHIQFMSTISQLLNRPGRERILACNNPSQLYRALTAPPELATTDHQAQPKPKTIAAGSTLGEYIKPELLKTDLQGSASGDVIAELLELLKLNGSLRDPAKAARAVMDREQQMPTGMERGIAIPHGRTDAVDRLVCAIGISPGGVDFHAIDGEPTKIVVLVLTPQEGGEPYLQFVASIMTALDEEGSAAAISASTSQELWQVLMQRLVK